MENTGGSEEYWKNRAKIRDDFTCQRCGIRDPEIVQVDHIKPRSTFPELSRNIDNMITLCPNCHMKKLHEDIRNGLLKLKGRPNDNDKKRMVENSN